MLLELKYRSGDEEFITERIWEVIESQNDYSRPDGFLFEHDKVVCRMKRVGRFWKPRPVEYYEMKAFIATSIAIRRHRRSSGWSKSMHPSLPAMLINNPELVPMLFETMRTAKGGLLGYRFEREDGMEFTLDARFRR
jgi:hypothetical protein